jgi:catechol 2,3-dioxygenase-like lactoylglutathione lyase family enzyme
LTAAKTAALRHAAFRARSPRALLGRVEAIEASDLGWIEEQFGHGPAYRFHDPHGHLIELYSETLWYEAPEDLRLALKNQAQRYPGCGVNVRRLDHFNLAVDIRANREFFQSALGFRLTEQIGLESGEEAGMWLTSTHKSSDFVYTKEAHGVYTKEAHGMRCAFTTSRTRSTHAKTCVRCSRPSSSMCSSRATIALRSRTLARGWCSRPTGSRSAGPRAGLGLKTIETFHMHGTPAPGAGPIRERGRGAGRTFRERHRVVTLHPTSRTENR